MRINAKVSTLLRVFKRLSIELSQFDDETIVKMRASWDESLRSIDSLMSSDSIEIPLGKIAAGLIQGLRDTQDIFSQLPLGVSDRALRCLRSILAEEMPNFEMRSDLLLRSVLSKGKIETDEEWDLVQRSIGQLERSTDGQNRLTELHRLADKYEQPNHG